MVFLLTGLFLYSAYAGLLLFYWKWWGRVKEYKPVNESVTTTKLSVVVAARNEEKNILQLLEALHEQTCPQSNFEVLVVDDHSTDATASLVQQFRAPNVRLLSLPAGMTTKKRAIQWGIDRATGDYIIATDADCRPARTWLQTLASFQSEEQSCFIAAPVVLDVRGVLLDRFQALDFLMLQAITAASVSAGFHSLCNGANLAYSKEAFREVHGFDQIDQVASGDDMLLMYKIQKRHPQQVHYLKSSRAIVHTQPMPTWGAFLQQRIRWSGKTLFYDDKKVFYALLVVYFFNVYFFILGFAGFWNLHYWYALLLLWILKAAVEWPLVSSAATFFQQRKLLRYFFFFQPLHIIYVVMIGLLSQFLKYEWKGRKLK